VSPRRKLTLTLAIAALLLLSLVAHAAPDLPVPVEGGNLVSGGAGGVVGAAGLALMQSVWSWWQKRDSQEQQARKVASAAERSAADATRDATLADVRSDLDKLESVAAKQVDVERIERLLTAEAAAGATFRESVARELGLLQGEVKAATAAAMAAGRTTD